MLKEMRSPTLKLNSEFEVILILLVLLLMSWNKALVLSNNVRTSLHALDLHVRLEETVVSTNKSCTGEFCMTKVG